MKILEKGIRFRWQHWEPDDVVVPTQKLLDKDENFEMKAYKVLAFTPPPTPSMYNPFAGTVFLSGIPYGVDGDMVTLPRLEAGGADDNKEE